MAGDSGAARWAEVVARAWSDDDYLKQLIADPLPLLREAGFNPPDNATISIVTDNAPNHFTLVIPAKPQADIADSADDDLNGFPCWTF